jgi:hypothetical protein
MAFSTISIIKDKVLKITSQTRGFLMPTLNFEKSDL